jgi:hypothetical protein
VTLTNGSANPSAVNSGSDPNPYGHIVRFRTPTTRSPALVVDVRERRGSASRCRRQPLRSARSAPRRRARQVPPAEISRPARTPWERRGRHQRRRAEPTQGSPHIAGSEQFDGNHRLDDGHHAQSRSASVDHDHADPAVLTPTCGPLNVPQVDQLKGAVKGSRRSANRYRSPPSGSRSMADSRGGTPAQARPEPALKSAGIRIDVGPARSRAWHHQHSLPAAQHERRGGAASCESRSWSRASLTALCQAAPRLREAHTTP